MIIMIECFFGTLTSMRIHETTASHRFLQVLEKSFSQSHEMCSILIGVTIFSARATDMLYNFFYYKYFIIQDYE